MKHWVKQKRLLSALFLTAVIFLQAIVVQAEEMQTEGSLQTENAGQSTEMVENGVQTDTDAALVMNSPSALLMEMTTGTVLYEKDAHTRRSPASVTKIMTTLLIFEALEKGQITLQDEVVTSAHAKSMGGSQVFLEEGEKQTVDTMLKCILVSSGNDASVAMAEYIAGSEQEFVSRMNEKAVQLGMTNTHFEDCCGLTDSDNHYTTAYDIALMSRDLMMRYPQVTDYTTIWMESITHVTDKGSSEFGLSNTNKLLRSYDGCTGLKTGSTSKALFCVSATAERNDVGLVSVIMAGPDSKTRFADAAAMLNYGFRKCRVYKDIEPPKLPVLKVKRGLSEQVTCTYEKEFQYLDMEGKNLEGIERRLKLDSVAEAPVKKGDVAGKLLYVLDGKEIGSVDILFAADVEKAGYLFYLKRAWEAYCM